MPASSPKFFTIFSQTKDRANLCTMTLLAWLSSSNGHVTDDEEAMIRRVAVAENAGEVAAVLEIALAGRVEDLEVACRYVMKNFPRRRKRLLAQLAITLAALDGRIAVGENYELQFFADLLGIAPRSFAKLFEQVTHRPLPQPGDPSSIEWWRRREAGVQAEPIQDLPPEPEPHWADTPRPTASPQTPFDFQPDSPPPPSPSPRSPVMTRTRAMSVLSVPADATADDVRSAFRRLAKMQHPDRFAKLGPSAIAAATEAFKQLEAAYTLLKGAA